MAEQQTAQQDDKLKKFVMARQSALETEKDPWLERYQDVVDYVSPHRDNLTGDEQPSAKKATKVYDGTAIGAAVLATDGIHGYHVSPAFPWFKYVMSRRDLMNIKSIAEWLQDSVAYGMYMALNRSNFYSEMWSFIYDGETIGTASLYVEEDIGKGRIIFDAVHPGETYVSEGPYGDVDVLHRKRKVTARNLLKMFGKENITDRVKLAAEQTPFQEFEVIHACYPREEYDSRKLDAKNKPYASVWILREGDGKIMRESGYGYFPYPTWRYLRSGKSPYGLSPAILAMCDVRGINRIGKSLQGYAQMAVDPPLNIPSELRGKVQWHPRGRNYYGDNENRTIKAANIGGNFPIGIDREERLERAIRERFHVDTFLMLSNLAGAGQKTAYEVSELMGEKAAVLGAELGPLNYTLDKILDIVFDIESAAGRIAPPPDELLELAQKGDRFDPEYIGPLAQAQRQKFGTQGILQGLQATGQLAALFPDALDNIDPDETAIQILDATGFPAAARRSTEKRDKVREARNQQAMAAQRQQGMIDAAGGVRDLAAADKDMGGPLAKMMNTNINATGEQVPAAAAP